jgi:hypothetical protein
MTMINHVQECQTEPERKSGDPESWLCVDCGVNTSPGTSTRAELEAAFAAGSKGVDQWITAESEVYIVRNAVWAAAEMKPLGGCLCIGCLETRLGRRLRPKDFLRSHVFNRMPGTPRLLKRRGVPRR